MFANFMQEAASKTTINDDMKLANILPPLFICINMATIWSVYVWLHLMPMLQIGVPAELRDEDLALQGLLQQNSKSQSKLTGKRKRDPVSKLSNRDSSKKP